MQNGPFPCVFKGNIWVDKINLGQPGGGMPQICIFTSALQNQSSQDKLRAAFEGFRDHLTTNPGHTGLLNYSH